MFHIQCLTVHGTPLNLHQRWRNHNDRLKQTPTINRFVCTTRSQGLDLANEVSWAFCALWFQGFWRVYEQMLKLHLEAGKFIQMAEIPFWTKWSSTNSSSTVFLPYNGTQLTHQRRESKRKADTEIQYRPRIVDTDIDCGPRFADPVSETPSDWTEFYVRKFYAPHLLPTLIFLSLPSFWKKTRKTTERAMICSLCRTPEVPGKEGKTLKKARKFNATKKARKERKIRVNDGGKKISGKRVRVYGWESFRECL